MKGDFSRRIFDAGKYAAVLHQQGRIWLDSDWNEQAALQEERLREETADIVGPSGFVGAAFRIEPLSGVPSDFHIAGGRAYLAGNLCQLPFDTTYLTQPFLLDPAAIPIPKDGSPLNVLIYLEAWARPISYLQDAAIREVALNGPDTTMRVQTVAQVKFAAIPSSVTDLTCPNAASLLPGSPDGTLTVIQNPPPPPTDICRIPDLGNYTGRENRLYRVEVHKGGVVSGAISSPPSSPPVSAPPSTFKWSRDNAAFAVGVTAISQSRLTLTVASLGRDQATALKQGDLVEISDDASELGPGAGFLTNLASDPDPDQLTVTLAAPLPTTFQSPPGSVPSGSPPVLAADRHLILRRWDGAGTVQTAFDPVATPDMDLGDGIQIHFGGATLQAGDYWQFAARTDGSVESLNNAPPQGIRRWRTPLALAQWTRPVSNPPSSPPQGYSMTVLHNCRTVFPPLAEPALHVEALTLNGANGPFPLLNDRAVLVADLKGGIDVLLDAAPAPAAISRAVCSLLVETPVPLSPATGAYEKAVADPQKANVGFKPTVLAGDATVNGNLISWRMRNPDSLSALSYELLPPGERGVLARFRLHGNFVWAKDNPAIFLDGDEFGVDQLPGQFIPATGTRLPSGDGRKGGIFETWFWLAPLLPLSATLTAAPPIVRAQGEAELIGDLVVTLTGGQPTAAGAAVPTFTISVNLSTPVANLTSGQFSDFLLLIDDPTTLNTSAFGTTPPAVLGVGGAGINYKNGAAPNVFQGQFTAGVASNFILFSGVPIDAPGLGQTRTVRLSNIRTNVFPALTPAGAPTSPPALVSASITGFPAALGPVTAALVAGGLGAFEVRNGQDGAGNPFSLFFPSMSGTGSNPNAVPPHAFLHFREGFANAFKTKSQEEGFANAALPATGHATQGTRLRAVFSNVPAGASIFVSLTNVSPIPSIPAPVVATLITTDASGSGGGTTPPAVGTTNAGSQLAAVPIVNGIATAVWEWTSPGNPASIDEAVFAVVLGVNSSNVGGSVIVAGSLVPVSILANVAPRFGNQPLTISPAFNLVVG